jgi:hypothetical protein
MTCRSCGATIADKAIVCYRCGTPTDVPPAAPRRTGARPPNWRAFLVLAVLWACVIAAMTYASPEHRTAIWIGGGLLGIGLGAGAFVSWRGR